MSIESHHTVTVTILVLRQYSIHVVITVLHLHLHVLLWCYIDKNINTTVKLLNYYSVEMKLLSNHYTVW